MARIAVGLAMLLATGGTGKAGTLVAFNFANFGTVQVDLFDDVTPVTVANHLQYINANTWDNSIIHRVDTSLGVIQGGGFNTGAQQVSPQFDMIVNETALLNKRGTISMARGGGLNTGQSQWFFNTDDNTVDLSQATTGGYAVFGWVVGSGMSVIDAIAAVPIFGYAMPFNQLPLQNFTQQDFQSQVSALGHFVVLSDVSVVSTHPSFQNPMSSVDVNNDGFLTNIDAFNIIDSLRSHGSHAANLFVGSDFRYRDPSGNGVITPLDARLVIDQLIRLGTGVPAPQVSALASPLAMGSVSPLFVVPEPSSVALAAMAALALAGCALKRRLRRRG